MFEGTYQGQTVLDKLNHDKPIRLHAANKGQYTIVFRVNVDYLIEYRLLVITASIEGGSE